MFVLMEVDRTQLAPYLSDGVCCKETVEQLTPILENVYGDSYRRKNTAKEFLDLRQKNNPIEEHIAAFQRLTTESRFDREASLSIFERSLSQELK